MLAWRWGKQNPYLPMVEEGNCGAAMEIGAEASQKARNRATISPSSIRPAHAKAFSISCRSTCTFISTAAPLPIAMKWNQPRCLSTSHWIRKRGYTMELYLCIKMKLQDVQKNGYIWKILY